MDDKLKLLQDAGYKDLHNPEWWFNRTQRQAYSYAAVRDRDEKWLKVKSPWMNLLVSRKFAFPNVRFMNQLAGHRPISPEV